MASVSKCDSCGKVLKHEECQIVKIYSETFAGKQGKLLKMVEICTSCTEKFLEMFSDDGSK